MIKIAIQVNDDGDITDLFSTKNTSLIENSLALRRLEEIKQRLLDMEYSSEIDVEEKQ